jgi:peptide/nickel transport system permease protein
MRKHRTLPAEKARKRVYIFLALALILIFVSIAAPYIIPNDPNKTDPDHMKTPPCMQFPFGTDKLGRCVFSRVLMGARTSIFSALTLVMISSVTGTVLGMICGYYGGILDEVIMRIADILLAFPQMVLAVCVAGILGGSLLNAMLAMGITGWTLYARFARSTVIQIKGEPFISAEKLTGNSDMRILTKHILPNILGPLSVNAATQIGTMMIGIAGLSFLGIGAVPPQAEWGSMINEARSYMQIAPWTVIAPGGAMVLTIMIFNYLGDSVRDLMDTGGRENV